MKQKLPWNEAALIQDLELDTLFNAMALGDKFLLEAAKTAILSGVNNDLGTILYRQDILKDCLRNPAIVKEIYAIAVDAIEQERKNYLPVFSRYPGGILHRSVEVLQMFMDMLKKLRKIADQNRVHFESEGFLTFFAMLQRELDDDYFALVQEHLHILQFRGGVSISAGLGKGNKGAHYVLRKPPARKQTWRERIFGPKIEAYSFTIAERDEVGARALTELKDRGINLVANALAQSNDHILSFFNLLRTELAFYMGCLNLHGQLTQKGEPTCFPLPTAPDERRHSFKGLYDVCLSLSLPEGVVGNGLDADDKNLVIITGANQGGKSTFLRSIGLSQLMMQCGLFAPAESFRSNLCDGLFTHYKREEDISMNSGKLDEELSRMSEIVDHLAPNALLLCNESFAATNEREGSEIARQITLALVEKRVKVFYVTHLYPFAHDFYDKRLRNAVFLRAERQANGARTFKLNVGEPLQTSYGEDLYVKIFATGNGNGNGKY
ncbi:MAG: DNA mismatch repair protein MutS [Chloroflexi bacterium]|nr:DNA mismatch repair protein MutS [Chloroflexota bacterium]